jgi:hypothetical protein
MGQVCRRDTADARLERNLGCVHFPCLRAYLRPSRGPRRQHANLLTTSVYIHSSAFRMGFESTAQVCHSPNAVLALIARLRHSQGVARHLGSGQVRQHPFPRSTLPDNGADYS